MKLIVAIIRPEKLPDVLEGLFEADVRGITVSRVEGHGGEFEQVETYRGATVKMELHDKVRVEIGVSEPFVERTVKALLESARRGARRTRRDARATSRRGARVIRLDAYQRCFVSRRAGARIAGGRPFVASLFNAARSFAGILACPRTLSFG